MPVLSVPTGTVTGQLVNALGNPVVGALVLAQLNAGNSTPQSISPAGQVVPVEVAAYTDATGAWSLPLVPNSNINPANTTYTISVQGMPPVQISLPDTASHSYLSIVVGGTGATLNPVGQTVAALTVTGLLTALGGEVVTGNLSAVGPDPWFDVKHPTYGAVGNGVANDQPAIQAAITACQSAGGGIVYLPPGTYALSSALQVTANVRVMVLGWGALLQPAANIDALFISQANGATALGCEVYGLVIDGQSRASTVGIRLRDTDRAYLRNVRIVNCTTGLQIESFTASRFAEENSLQDSFIWNCTTGVNVAAPGGTGSLGETHMFNVGISQCATGVALNSPITFYRCRLLGITIWEPSNGTGLKIDCNVQDSVFLVDFENLNGTQVNLTGVLVTTNAVNIPTLDAHFGFTGTFATAVSDATSKGLIWSDGPHRYTTAAGNGFNGIMALLGDTVDRIRAAGQFAGGGGFQFGSGGGVDVNLYRASAAILATDYGMRTGVAGTAGSTLYSGSGAPAAGLGSNGDYYLRTDTPGTANQRLYVKSAGAWVGIL